MNSNTPQCPACSGAGVISCLSPCSQCQGTGTTSTPVACANCAGSGTHTGRACGRRRNLGRRPIPPACSACNGTGSYTSTVPCSTCAQRPLSRRLTDSSYFTFNGSQNISPRRSQRFGRYIAQLRDMTWIYARHVRAQVANAPTPGRTFYPNYFGNVEGLPMQASAPLEHIPIFRGRTTTYTAERKAGKYRAFYNDSNRGVFDVGYHDPNKKKTSKWNRPFTLGHYHSAKVASVDEQNMKDDSSKVGDSSDDPNSTEDVPMSGI